MARLNWNWKSLSKFAHSKDVEIDKGVDNAWYIWAKDGVWHIRICDKNSMSAYPKIAKIITAFTETKE